MIENKFYNIDTIASFEVFYKKPCEAFIFKKQNKNWFNYTEEGFYLTDEYLGLPSEPYSIDDLESGNNHYDISFIVEENNIYYKPHIKIEFINNNFKYKYFNTSEECSEFIKQNLNSKNFKNI